MSDTRQAIMDTALELMQLKTYSGFSFQDVADQVGIRKASIYHHFPSKASLATAVLEELNLRFTTKFQGLEDRSPVARIEALFSHFARYLGPGRKVCPGGAMSAVWDGLNPDIRKAARNLIDSQRDWLAQTIREGRENGSIADFGTTPHETAAWVLSNLSGGMLGARILGQAEAFDNTLLHLRRLLFTQT